MPIKRRLSDEERLQRQLPKNWDKALHHPLLAKLCYKRTAFDPTPANIVRAINMTKGWKGATYTEKVFVQALDLVLEKAYGIPVLEPDTYNRLQDHLINNEDKIAKESLLAWQVWVWDIYHDHYKLQDMEAGELHIPLPVLTKPKRKLKKHLRKKLPRK
jgi:hypothetical protein